MAPFVPVTMRAPSSSLEATAAELDAVEEKRRAQQEVHDAAEADAPKAAGSSAASVSSAGVGSVPIAVHPLPIYGARTDDPITAALTAPSNPSARYYNVLRALVAAVRTQLLPLNEAPLFALPAKADMGPAFPQAVRDEDPEYFFRQQLRDAAEAGKNSEYSRGMRRAWAVAPSKSEELFYAFDRKPLPMPGAAGKQAAARLRAAEASMQGGGGKDGDGGGGGGNGGGSGRTAVVVGADREARAAELAAMPAPPAAPIHTHRDAREAQVHGVVGVEDAPLPPPQPLRRAAVGSGAAAAAVYAGRRRASPAPAIDVAPPGEGDDEDSRRRVMRSHGFRDASAHAILGRQGRNSGVVSVAAAAGNASIGTGGGGTSGPPLAPDVMSDTLRWAQQQRVAAERRRARCEHVLALLAKELAAEAARQKRLRLAASRFAVSEARFRGDPTWASYQMPENAKKGRAAARDADVMSGLDPRELRKSTRFRADEEKGGLGGAKGGGGKGGGGGATRYLATDLAQERFEIARERAESCDALMRILEDYRLVPLTVASQYLDETLRDVDDLYAELVGARAQHAAGGQLSDAEVRAHVDALRSGVELAVDEELAREDEALAGGDGPDGASTVVGGAVGGAAGGAAGARGAAAARLRRARRAKAPVLPSAFYREAGGAVPLTKHEDPLEVTKFGAARPGGLSGFNMRPYLGRKAVRDEATLHLPELYEGFDDPAAREAARTVVAAAGAGVGELYDGIRAQRREDARDQQRRRQRAGVAGGGADEFEARSPYAAPVLAAGAIPDAPPLEHVSAILNSPTHPPTFVSPPRPSCRKFPPPLQVEWLEARASELSRDPTRQNFAKVVGGQATAAVVAAAAAAAAAAGGGAPGVGAGAAAAAADAESLAIGGSTNLFSRVGRLRAGERARAEERAAQAAKRAAEQPTVRLESDGVPKEFQELAADLSSWREHSRPIWQQQIMKSYDTSNMRESTGLMLGIIQRTAKEPPSGRFSHLLGRYYSSDDLRKQLADSLKMKAGAK